MSRREEGEERQVNGLGVPDGQFPDIILRIWMRARSGRLSSKLGGKVR